MSSPRRGLHLVSSRLVWVPALAACVLLATVPAAAAEPTMYSPPVDGAVVDGYRPPGTPYGPGNRGIDYATVPGEEVRAAADGEVTFAGQIGPSAHVVVLHPDGVRTSYSFLDTVTVRRGERVSRGQGVGTAGAVLHFGARAGERYIDPTLLLANGPAEVHLVPAELRTPQSEAEERHRLVELLGEVVGGAWSGLEAGAGALAWAGEVGWENLQAEIKSRWTQLVLLSSYVGQLPSSPLFLLHAAEMWSRAERFRNSQEGCTPATQPVPPPPAERRIAVLVAGFGSSTATEADVLGVDTGALGYADADVVQFSYAGGRAPGVGALSGVAVNEYGPEDSTGDLFVSGERLAALLDVIRRQHPGVPVDVIAHSQGGVVARLALGTAGAGADPRFPPVANLVTLGSPHLGTDIATANALLGTTSAGELAQEIGAEVTDGSLDGTSPAAAQLAETSSFIDELDDMPLPAGTRVTSIAARGDLSVGALHSSLEGATNVMVPLEGPSAHGELPSSDLTEREMALALAGRGPTCRDLTGDVALAAAISTAADAIGLSLGLGALWLDRSGRRSSRPASGARVPAPAGR